MGTQIKGGRGEVERNSMNKWLKYTSIALGLLMIVGMTFANERAFHQPSVVSASSEKEPLQQQAELPSVHVIGTGGTISAQSKDETSFQEYRSGVLDIQKDMVDQLPHLDRMANVSTTQFGNRGSSGYSIEDLYDLSLLVDEKLNNHDGVVVTTGTDTMEEIAYFLDLTVRSTKPVVVTGSMRPWTVISSDAQANLFNAIKLAASGKTERFGTVMMLNDEIFAARNATKLNSYRLDAFESPRLGILGYIDQDNIRIYHGTTRAYKDDIQWATPFDLREISKENLPKVEIAYSYQDAGGEAIEAFAEGGAKGIVTAGTGAGGVSSEQRRAMSQAIEKGVIFLKTTRTGSGSVYGNSNGVIAADNLNPQHARILLLLALAYSDDYDTVAKWVEKYGNLQDEEIHDPTDPVSASDIKKRVAKFEADGAFKDADAAHSLKIHLTAVSRYEDQEEAEKVVQHMEGFKRLLEEQEEHALISEDAFNTLYSEAEMLINQWQE